MSEPADAPTPFFLDGPSGALFCHYLPPQGAAPGEAALFVPPFAEEMNRARPIMAAQARKLAACGLGVLLLDLFGTGDSAGDFGDASWAAWRADITAGLDWLESQGHGTCTLIGLRLGACLALEAARAAPAVSRVVLWQPVLRGQVYLQQFLRIRVGSAMVKQDDAESGETVKGLRQRLTEGETLEVGGYALNPGLAEAIDGLTLIDLAAGLTAPLHWFEISAQEPPALTPASQAAQEKLAASGLTLDTRAVLGEAFWAIEETTPAPALVAATTALWTTSPRSES
ncbi:MAG: hydrolase 2, exosortase A system-associated [Pseudomonadota bacterium]